MAMKSPGLGQLRMAALNSIIVFLLLLATVSDVGLTWDEPAYIAAAKSYMGWYGKVFTQPSEALTANGITSSWEINKEHPPLDKVWSGLVWEVARNFTDDLTAHRMGNMLLVAILAGLLYLLVYDAYGQVAGLAAVAALLTMPRFFFHAHLAALDVPAAFSVFVVTLAFWKTRDKAHWSWDILLGLVWGLALATKINAVFVPITLGIWWLVFSRQARLIVRMIVMGVTGLLVFVLSWPWLYLKPVEHFTDYILFITTEHWKIGQYYLGQYFMPPPWHFGFVMMWAVLPLSLTILYFVGIFRAGTGKHDSGLGWLLFLSALTPILAIAIGQSMVYDNERLMMASFPFLAALAGSGFGWIVSGWKKLSERWERKALFSIGVIALVILSFVPQLVTMVRLYPHYLSYYGEWVGGLAGATRMGLETTYWCESYTLAFPIINAQAEPKAKVWADPWSHDVLIYYQTQGRLRQDLVIVGFTSAPSILGPDVPGVRAVPLNGADWYIFQHRQSMFGEDGEKSFILSALKKKEIVYEYSFDGVPVMTLYK